MPHTSIASVPIRWTSCLRRASFRRVATSRRGKGLGRFLLDAVVRLLTERAAARITLHVKEDNDVAIRMYIHRPCLLALRVQTAPLHRSPCACHCSLPPAHSPNSPPICRYRRAGFELEERLLNHYMIEGQSHNALALTLTIEEASCVIS
jgi:ribosomal protein S18 acetylase RimI-like enzyme